MSGIVKKLTREEAIAWAKAGAELEEACTCKHCGACVLCGPPCCYGKLNDLYEASQSEVGFLRKQQSVKDKEINRLKKQIEYLEKQR